MQTLISTAADVQLFCEEQKWQFCFIGSLALLFWGEARLTKDIDLTIFTGFENEEVYIDKLLEKFNGRIEDAKEFALKNRVLLLETENGIGIDISLGAYDFEKEMIERAAYQKYFKEYCLNICSAEDLIVLKSFAARGKDWNDISGILIKRKNLDWHYVYDKLKPLVELKGELKILTNLGNLREDYI